MQLNRVVFPAPLGPIRPRIALSGTSNDTLSSATIPPNRMLTPRIESSALVMPVSLSAPVPASRTSCTAIALPGRARQAGSGPAGAVVTRPGEESSAGTPVVAGRAGGCPAVVAGRGDRYPAVAAGRGDRHPEGEAGRAGGCPAAEAGRGDRYPAVVAGRGDRHPEGEADRAGGCPAAGTGRGGRRLAAEAGRGGRRPAAEAGRGGRHPAGHHPAWRAGSRRAAAAWRRQRDGYAQTR